MAGVQFDLFDSSKCQQANVAIPIQMFMQTERRRKKHFDLCVFCVVSCVIRAEPKYFYLIISSRITGPGNTNTPSKLVRSKRALAIVCLWKSVRVWRTIRATILSWYLSLTAYGAHVYGFISIICTLHCTGMQYINCIAIPQHASLIDKW